MDGAPVGEPGHQQARQAGERPLVVERRAEDVARLGEEREPLLRRLRDGTRLLLRPVQARLVDRERDPVGGELEEARVLAVEPVRLQRADVEDADHVALGDEGHRDERADAALAQHRADELVLSEVAHDERLPPLRDPAGEPLAEGHLDDVLQLRPEAHARAALQRGAGLVEQQNRRSVRVEQLDEANEELVQQVLERQVRQRRLGHALEAADRAGGRLRLLARGLLGAVETRVLDGDRRAARELLRELELLGAVAPAGLRLDEADRAERRVADDERDDDRRA